MIFFEIKTGVDKISALVSELFKSCLDYTCIALKPRFFDDLFVVVNGVGLVYLRKSLPESDDLTLLRDFKDVFFIAFWTLE